MTVLRGRKYVQIVNNCEIIVKNVIKYMKLVNATLNTRK